MRVLHVDDDHLMRELVKISMGHCGACEVFSFESGSAALDHLRAHTVDLIISDVMMPQMNGVQFVGAVREQGLSQAPVVFLTSGFDLKNTALKALDPVAILAKPFDPFGLPGEICRHLANAAVERPCMALA